MQYFEQFTSNTVAGSGNQLFFGLPADAVKTGRVFYKIAAPGTFSYSILFSNLLDSTFADGAVSHKNLICDSWEIHRARIGVCKTVPADWETAALQDADFGIADFQELTFGGKSSKTVMPGEFFTSDPIALCFEKGTYLCLEIAFSGCMIPYHEESLLPVFGKDGDVWRYDKKMPFAGMVGCDRKVKARIGYLGDSITQGIGTKNNAYAHWNALLSEKIGTDYAFWNLGLGYGRANDAASDGAWLYKARQNDIVFVCYGVNDLLQGLPEEQIKQDLKTIVEKLKQAGIKVVLQTVRPFVYPPEAVGKWARINDYIKDTLQARADMVFDTVPVLGEPDAPHMAKYGGHPNEEGCRVWADALYAAVKEKFPVLW